MTRNELIRFIVTMNCIVFGIILIVQYNKDYKASERRICGTVFHKFNEYTSSHKSSVVRKHYVVYAKFEDKDRKIYLSEINFFKFNKNSKICITINDEKTTKLLIAMLLFSVAIVFTVLHFIALFLE